mmetsp:Transcript_4246/g.8693  ORF Transcript_4246/g.8693 Transcript_4246/m.8693 type:complete len:92 (-) Transcript_4246:451-726(-)
MLPRLMMPLGSLTNTTILLENNTHPFRLCINSVSRVASAASSYLMTDFPTCSIGRGQGLRSRANPHRPTPTNQMTTTTTTTMTTMTTTPTG